MGAKSSIYEKPGALDYVKLSSEDHTLIKNVWSDIESNPQFYGTAFFTSFLEAYPQYIKFFTLEQYRPLNLDVRTTAKFTIIMEAMGFLFLDFHNKPKQLDRLVGYIAMVHKDMKLEKQDIFNLGFYMLGFLSETFPTKMTAHSREVITKFLVNILNEISKKMDYFRNCEMANMGIVSRSTNWPCGDWAVLGESLIFGQPRSYWVEWKDQWETRMKNWSMESAKSLQATAASSTDEEDMVPQKSEKSGDTTPEIIDTTHHRSVVSIVSYHSTDGEQTSSRLALKNLAQRLESTEEDHSSKRGEAIESPKHHTESTTPQSQKQEDCPTKHISGRTARERHRARSLAREITNPQHEGIVLRKRVRSSRIHLPVGQSQNLPKNEEPDNKTVPTAQNTARGRHRASQQFSYDLK